MCCAWNQHGTLAGLPDPTNATKQTSPPSVVSMPESKLSVSRGMHSDWLSHWGHFPILGA